MFFLKKILKTLPQKYRKFLRRLWLNPLLYSLSSNKRPLSNYSGFDRGVPIDRYYIEKHVFLNRNYIKGCCLELLNNDYTIKYGKTNVTKSDILDIDSTNIKANIIGDIRNLKNIRDNSYDCIILTQVLQFIDNPNLAISECSRILKTNGHLIATLPSIGRIDISAGINNDFWRFTQASAKFLFEKVFGKQNVSINSYGNAKIGQYFYAGLAIEDVNTELLEYNDPDFPLIVSITARKT